MNIALVVHRYDAGEGTGGYVTQLLPRIARVHHVTLYAAMVATPVPENVRVVRVPALPRPATARILSFPLGFAAVRGRHDVVHAQGWVARDADVVTAHVILPAWRAAARPDGMLSLGERATGPWVAAAEGALVRRARAVIVPSRRARADLATWHARHHEVHVIPHGFLPRPAARRDRKRFDLPEDAFVALYVGDARKGLTPAVEAVARTGVWLLVVSHSRPDRYAAHAERLGVGGRFRWAGPIDDIGAAYAASDVLVHPSRYDTFGLGVAEAMAVGLPVVVSSRAGVSELIRHEDNGWIADDGDALVAALTRLAADPTLRGTLGTAARRTAERYTWDVAADRTLTVYESLRRR